MDKRQIPFIKYFKVTIVSAVVILILIEQVISAIMARHIGVIVPIIDNWLYFDVFLNVKSTNVLGFTLPNWFNLLVIPFGVLCFRIIYYKPKEINRLIIIPLSLFMAIFLCRYLNIVFYGGNIKFIAINYFFIFGILDIYRYICILNGLHCIFILIHRLINNKNSIEKEGFLSYWKEYFKYEADNIKVFVLKMRKK